MYPVSTEMRAPPKRPFLWTVTGLGAAGIAGLAGGFGFWRRHSTHPGQKPVGLEGRAGKRVELIAPSAPPLQPEMRYPLGLAAAILVLMVLIVAIVWWFDHRRQVQQEANVATGGVGERAIPIMLANGCAGCHTIQGVPSAQGLVGPKLDSPR
jgi:mono/diheme cytochrome c family protein